MIAPAALPQVSPSSRPTALCSFLSSRSSPHRYKYHPTLTIPPPVQDGRCSLLQSLLNPEFLHAPLDAITTHSTKLPAHRVYRRRGLIIRAFCGSSPRARRAQSHALRDSRSVPASTYLSLSASSPSRHPSYISTVRL